MSIYTTYHVFDKQAAIMSVKHVVQTITPISGKSYYYTTFKDFDTFSPDYY